MSNDMIIYNTEDGKSKISLKIRKWNSMVESDGKVTVNYQLIITRYDAIKGKIQTKKVIKSRFVIKN